MFRDNLFLILTVPVRMPSPTLAWAVTSLSVLQGFALAWKEV
jgi:hypothetical protein